MGHVGRFRSAEPVRHRRGARVVIRTERGLELGEVLGDETPRPNGGTGREQDGVLLRRATVSDELLAARLEKNRQEAYEACVRMLQERGVDAVLIDVEHLFDGRGLYFYFLGPVSDELESLTQELATAYDAEARFQQFTEAVEQGCGPACGTPEGQGGGACNTCASCAVTKACTAAGE